MQSSTPKSFAWMIAALLSFAPLAGAFADPAATKPADADAAKTKAAPVAQSPRKLDLKAPPINHVFSPGELQTLTHLPEEIGEGAETVDVKGARHERVYVPPGFAGMGWAIRHPTQAWRLFVPAPSE